MAQCLQFLVVVSVITSLLMYMHVRSLKQRDVSLLNSEDQDCVETVLKYIEDIDLRRWSLADIKAFSIGLGQWRSMLNCITNPHMYEQVQ